MSKIYTKTGDRGTTGLVDGSRVSKADVRIEALGCLDEANAALGVLIASFRHDPEVSHLLYDAQHMLFTCGSRIAEPQGESRLGLQLPDKAFISRYEASIDSQTEKLSPLTQFILPGGSEASSFAHLARTVVRRTERSLVRLKESEQPVDDLILMFVNRLSDWLFTYARTLNKNTGNDDIFWQSKRKD